jgi:thymidylate synthase (FAD)
MGDVIVVPDAATYPEYHPHVFETSVGTLFLKEPGIVMIGKPQISLEGLRGFFTGYPEELNFLGYLDDPTDLPPGAKLCKFAGQMCYVACGTGRTWNKAAVGYFLNILKQRHGSVLEHANYSFHLYGVSRSLTHELVRHRAGFAYSQISQRYVDGKVLRFVMRPEFVGDELLESMFYQDIDQAAASYAARAQRLMELQAAGVAGLTADKKTALRKNVQQAARSVLPNETEAPIVVSANARSWRHFLEMRASEHAEPEIRRLAMRIYKALIQVEPILFGDYTVIDLPGGTQALHTDYVKV